MGIRIAQLTKPVEKGRTYDMSSLCRLARSMSLSTACCFCESHCMTLYSS